MPLFLAAVPRQLRPALNTNFFQVNALGPRDTQLRALTGHGEASGRDRGWLTLWQTAHPLPRSNYELFNCSNFNIHY